MRLFAASDCLAHIKLLLSAADIECAVALIEVYAAQEAVLAVLEALERKGEGDGDQGDA